MIQCSHSHTFTLAGVTISETIAALCLHAPSTHAQTAGLHAAATIIDVKTKDDSSVTNHALTFYKLIAARGS